jgi:hypothetical protein
MDAVGPSSLAPGRVNRFDQKQQTPLGVRFWNRCRDHAIAALAIAVSRGTSKAEGCQSAGL